MIRPITHADIPWLVDLFDACHTKHERDTPRWTEFVHLVLDHDQTIAVRGEHSAAIAVNQAPPWSGTELNCCLMHLFSRPQSNSPMEPVALLNEVDRRRKAMGAKRFFILSTEKDLTPFAVRLGARPVGSLHVLDDAT